MKLKVNMPNYENGTDLEVMHVGPVKNGSTVELTEGQVSSLREAGYDLPEDDGTFEIYKEAPQPAQTRPATTKLPGVEEIAERERERKKSTRKSERSGDK